MPLDQRVRCRTEKDIFNQEVQQQWQLNQHNTSADEFAQNWNFLCNFHGPPKSRIYHGRLSDAHQNFDDEEDSMQDDTDFEEEKFEALERNKHIKRKRVSLCKHKLKRRAYPKCRNKKMAQQLPQQFSGQKEVDLNYEWLQLIQMENFIENQKRELLENGAQDLHDDNEAWDEHQQTERHSIEGEEDTLDDEDLAYITTILDSFAKPKLIDPVSPEGAPMRVPTRPMTPPKFNQQVNQNSTNCGSDESHFNYFSNVEEEGTSELGDYFSDDEAELGDYFSDDEEDDTWEEETLTSESNLWSQTNFNNSEGNFQHLQSTLSEWDPVISGLETIGETRFEDDSETNKLNHISGLSEEIALAFSAWQPYIPPEPPFQNLSALSWRSAFSQPASFSQEPTLTQISTITTKQTQAPRLAITPRQKITQSQQQDWNSFRPATRHYTHTWRKSWPKSSKTCNRTQTYRTKLPKNNKRHQRNSKRTPLWLWSPGLGPPICSLHAATTEKPTLERKISPRGDNHFSKRRSESESYRKCKSINERHRSKSKDKNSKSESKGESKDIKVRNENNLVTFSTDAEAKVTAKADEVKAIKKTQTEFRMEIGKQLDKRIGSDLPVTLPLHFATTFNMSIIIGICVTFTIFILIFNSFFHHFQTFTLGNLRVYEMLCSSQRTASSQAKTAETASATPDSIPSFRVPETRPNILYRNLHRNTLVPKHLRSLGRSRNPENDCYNDSFILIYLDLPR
jgi:hypothetical protein